jgi:hypothetical protein
MPPLYPANDNQSRSVTGSPYLNHEPREIWQACHDVLAERGIWKSPCETCTLFSICRPPTDLVGIPAAQ